MREQSIKNRSYLIPVSVMLLSCLCLGQSGRQPAKTTTTEGPTSSPNGPTTSNAARAKTRLWVALSRPRRLVMLPDSNQFYAAQIARSLASEARLDVEFDPHKVKVEDAQLMLRSKPRTYMLLLRFEEIDDRDDSRSCDVSDPKRVTSYKMDYTLLSPEGKIVKKRSIQTFFSCARNAKPLFEFLVKNCVNRSRNTLDDSATQCMAQHVYNDLFDFEK